MSSLKQLSAEIGRFLEENEPEALCISGAWGVGKTYSWNRFYEKAVASGKIARTRYSYASLFGISSLEALKTAIFENTSMIVDPNDPEPELSDLKSRGNKVLGFAKKNKALFASVPVVGKFIAEAGPLYFASVRNQFICIDDLERRGAGLSVRDVLGLISFLKEQRRCKIILLLNDGELGASESEFREDFEKVFDSSLCFIPTPEESAGVVIEGNDDVSKQLKSNCVKLKIANIRVIAKIQRFAKMLQDHMAGSSSEVLKQALSTLVLYCFCQFLPKSAPSTEYVLSGHLRGLMRLQEAEISDEEKTWRATLSAYGYEAADDLDKAILSGIKNGYFDGDLIKVEAEKLRDSFEHTGRNSELSKAWDVFRFSFEDNVNSVVDAMQRGIVKTKNLSSGNLDSSVRLLKELGFVEEAKVSLCEFIDNKVASARYWDLRNHHGEVVTDPDVISAFAAKHQSLTVTPDPRTTLLKIADGKGYEPSELKCLASLSTETFESILVAARGDDLENIIRGGLYFERVGNADAAMIEITQKVTQALSNISSTSTLNALRVRNITGIARR